jgi:phosphoserine phosphatase RsbU/P
LDDSCISELYSPSNLIFRISDLRCRNRPISNLFHDPPSPGLCGKFTSVLAFSRLNWLQRITLILFVTAVLNWIGFAATGYSLIGSDLFTILLIVFLVLLGVTLVRPIVRKLVWRVRNRLLVTYFLIGVVPVVLMVIFVCIGFYLVLGQTANYLLRSELERREIQIYNSAERLAEDVAAGTQRPSTGVAETIIRVGSRPSPGFPTWSTPGFRGIVMKVDGSHFFAAHAAAGTGERHTDVFAYQKVDHQTLAELLPGLASVMLITGENLNFKVGQYSNPKARIMDSEDLAPPPAARGFWDLALESPMPHQVRLMENGEAGHEVFVLQSRPSVILTRLFSTLGSIGVVLGIFLLVIACAFLVVVIIGILFSTGLIRSLTRSVHDLYIGTKKVEAGDFSHRVPIRTKDQFSELATSFNNMTQRVERLIVEVKEKEKFESELEIARQVQTQLFPREVPKLKTLELAGVCHPARVVSGDYYDFIPLDSRSTALVIGDISGKGISAALLMASVQSSLHAQLTIGKNGGISTATLVSRLNRQLYENTPPEKYATFYCGLYDDQSGLLTYTNAGHLAPLLIRQQNVIRLESNGMAVGLFPEVPYEQNVLQLCAGDLLTAFTDGITETENANGEQFGEQRLSDLIIRYRERPLDEISRIVTDAVRNWASDIDMQDDTTIVLARRL